MDARIAFLLRETQEAKVNVNTTDKLKRALSIIRDGKNNFVSELELLKSHPPDPKKSPATYALAQAYMSRLERLIAVIESLPEDLALVSPELPREQSAVMMELQEIGSWIKRQRRPGHEEITLEETAFKKGIIGDWLVSRGFLYSETSQLIEHATKPKRGAPTANRSDTVAAYDLKQSGKLSLQQLAAKVCDCGQKKHGTVCRDKVRKRLSELEKVLEKYGIAMPDSSSK